MEIAIFVAGVFIGAMVGAFIMALLIAVNRDNPMW